MPLIQSLGLAHHLVDCEKPEETFGEKDGNTITNLEYEAWINNNGLLLGYLVSCQKKSLDLLLGWKQHHNFGNLWKNNCY